LAKIKEQEKDYSLCKQGKPYAAAPKKKISKVGKVMGESYGIRVYTINEAINSISGDLDYLCSLIENPDPDFPIKDALVYSRAVTALCYQLDLAEKIAENELSDDGEYIKVSEEELVAMGENTDNTDDTLLELEEVCGISLKKN
jgi:hypothetical protein